MTEPEATEKPKEMSEGARLTFWGGIIAASIAAASTVAVAVINDDDDDVPPDPSPSLTSEPRDVSVPTVGTAPPGAAVVSALERVFDRPFTWGAGVDALQRRGFAVAATESGCACTSGRTYTIRSIRGSMGVLNATEGTATFYQGSGGLIELVVFLDGSLDEAREALRRTFRMPAGSFERRSTVVEDMRVRVATNNRGQNVVRLWNQEWFARWEEDCGPVTPCVTP